MQAVRQGEIRRLALALRAGAAASKANAASLREIVVDLAPGLLDLPGLGPVTAAQTLVSHSHRGRVRNDAASPPWPEPAPSPPAAA